MIESKKFKPCPFCGGQIIPIIREREYVQDKKIKTETVINTACLKCGTEFSFNGLTLGFKASHPYEKLINWMNRRYVEDDQE